MRHSALTWVKVTIDESLKQTRQALEQFVENPNDKAPLQQCIVWLHEIRGVLNMLELQTAGLLVQDLELTIKTLLIGKIENSEKTYDILMRGLVQLPNYLDHLAIIQRDMPLALLPLLNELRVLRQQPVLSALTLFTPDVSVTLPPVANTPKLADDKFKPYINQMRATYQKALMVLLKTPQEPADALKLLYSVMQKMQQITGNAPLNKVWWITEGVLEALLQKGLALNNNLITAFKQMDGLLKQMVDHGNASLRLIPPKPLMINLLYFAAQARSTGKQITAVKSTFNLADYLPTENVLQTTRLIFSGPDIELIKIVVKLIKDDFARIEETLDIFNRADNPSVSELAPLVGMLRDMANTLGLLGLMMQRKSMLTQAALIQEICEERRPANLTTMLEIANALLKTDSALDILAVQGVHARQRLQQSPDTEFAETPQFGIVLSVAVNEAKTDLNQVIHPIVTFIDNKTQDETLMDVPERLKQVQGFLALMSHERAAKLLAYCNNYIVKTFIKDGIVPPEEQLKALADALLSIELYLDTLAGNPMDAKHILDLTQQRLSVLVKQ
ncbi:hypothetical protein [Beggiatoa leptomitoformis]|uniref:Scaffold protein FimL second domain-containing protein n=1 Tax=Beggiatoa leptomitoformis TaxID=288004 RepID=A0A2N9YG37_9GAMM|nr:hypothetical protein [Beggiatoa leptomitoformis]ALG68249.1 hypothetical protein AL038_11685 [Beggiatoa leptomitoformis]AUI69443.1 hypothetical protein BLE401_12590 [Beggiatoa leptomitoformis]